ncbi:pyridoxamine 5'-phosphate oxidase [Gordonia sp. X0973]|uniref:pyridoxine/pyridoxamine 5'-phosphate oxidase n=1 Tax=Gordonia sp. X0973 TaxID=2742602 RepID=UPI000F52381B|nr:pyridoxal 5'-phosphate synthase [Gordonia sp. X0973]QKT06795.1 pyridoxamine 5'-phosphate oxidase [Gordonia sp. X0973]
MTGSWSDDGGRELLRSLPVLRGEAPGFDPDDVPADPVSLFAQWLCAAVDAGVPEPHAMTLSTVGPDGEPHARVLIVKAVDDEGWHFAVNAKSQKGVDLAGDPRAALTFYWPELVRQVRVLGRATDRGAAASAADFLARPSSSRSMAITARQSQPFDDPAELDLAIAEASDRVAADPDFVFADWVSYALRPDSVEFWEGAPDRRHVRLLYRRAGDGWDRSRLWP